jgi:hypothetical protein
MALRHRRGPANWQLLTKGSGVRVRREKGPEFASASASRAAACPREPVEQAVRLPVRDVPRTHPLPRPAIGAREAARMRRPGCARGRCRARQNRSRSGSATSVAPTPEHASVNRLRSTGNNNPSVNGATVERPLSPGLAQWSEMRRPEARRRPRVLESNRNRAQRPRGAASR